MGRMALLICTNDSFWDKGELAIYDDQFNWIWCDLIPEEELIKK